MVESLNGTNFQYWTKVMLDIQKANALGDSPDFPIIKVSPYSIFIGLIVVIHDWLLENDDKFSFIIFFRMSIQSYHKCWILLLHTWKNKNPMTLKEIVFGLDFWPRFLVERRNVYMWSIWLFLWPVRRQRSHIKVTKVLKNFTQEWRISCLNA